MQKHKMVGVHERNTVTYSALTIMLISTEFAKALLSSHEIIAVPINTWVTLKCPYAPSSKSSTSSSLYQKHKKAKRRAYDQRDAQTEHDFLSPLVFSITGGMGRAKTVHRRVAMMIADKRNKTMAKPWCGRDAGFPRCGAEGSRIASNF